MVEIGLQLGYFVVGYWNDNYWSSFGGAVIAAIDGFMMLLRRRRR
jgi:LPXTG-motif cell wall-anchored protein